MINNLMDLQIWLSQNEEFRNQAQQVRLRHVARQFASDAEETGPMPDWSYLMLCASVLAPSSKGHIQDMALRLAHACLEDLTSTAEQRASAASVLHSLLNAPSIKLAAEREMIPVSIEKEMPAIVRADWFRRASASSTIRADGSLLLLNSFQNDLLDSTQTADWISVSAPTSAGKSYALLQFLEFAIGANPAKSFAYIVPTRALVTQVAGDIRQHLNSSGIQVVTLPWLDIDRSVQCVYVLTQERLHILLARIEDLTIHSIIIDEAHKLGDANRGILLQQAITRALYRNEQLKVLFLMPYASNPALILEGSPASAKKKVVWHDERTVNQNLLWARQEPRNSKDWKLHLVAGKDEEYVKTFRLPSAPSPESKRLPYVAYALGESSGGNLVYVNRPSDAEKAALQLSALRTNFDVSSSQDILELIELVRFTIHKDYALAIALESGVGFHYGSMPQLVRASLESLFRKNVLKYMVCTSTLIEGVNLACKNIFVRGPKKGNGNAMSDSDFWNMGGRAGRWGYEFQGNIVCVDPDLSSVWRNGAPRIRVPLSLERSLDLFLQRPADLKAYIERGLEGKVAPAESQLSYTTSYLVTTLLEFGTLDAAPWPEDADADTIRSVEMIIGRLIDQLRFPADLFLRNPGVDVFGMFRLLEYFRNSEASGKREPNYWLLADPGSSDFVHVYTGVLTRLTNAFPSIFGKGNRPLMLAILLRDWMRGHQISRLIESRIERFPALSLSSAIRDCLKDIEEFARFKCPKYIRVYGDVLRYHLDEAGRHDLAAQVREYDFELELGVSVRTQLSLMSLGVSRSTAIAASEYIPQDSLSTEEAIQWLRQNMSLLSSMPRLALAELNEALRSIGLR